MPIGLLEIVVIVVGGLIFLGPQKMGLMARQLGRVMRELQRMASEFQQTLDAELDLEEEHARRSPAQLPARGDSLSGMHDSAAHSEQPTQTDSQEGSDGAF